METGHKLLYIYLPFRLLLLLLYNLCSAVPLLAPSTKLREVWAIRMKGALHPAKNSL